MLHNGALVLLAYGKGPSGTYRDACSTYRLNGGTWERMGMPAAESVDLLLAVKGGELWRMGRTAERWNGSSWETGVRFPASYFGGYRIKEACAGMNGEFFLVLRDEDNKDHLACAPSDGELRWLKGTAEAAVFKYGLYDPFCDKDGSLYVDHAGSLLHFTAMDFDYAADGYPTKDEKAREVYTFFTAAVSGSGTATERFGAANKKYVGSRSEEDYLALEKAYESGLKWHVDAIAGMKALGIEENRNRLYDAFLSALEAGKDQLYYQWKMAEAIHAGGDFTAYSEDLMEANGRQVAAIAALDEATNGYATRNGIMP